ncbi:MAG: DNA-binding protein [Parcubacteria group bacterium GW2011_GWE1_40_20]|nr:MAG: DNA-binding protein [Parcubacteria group bacterium GW2011_GWE1_40_20]
MGGCTGSRYFPDFNWMAYKFLYKKIGVNVKKIRKQKQVTQEKLAFDAHLNRTFIGCVERGERNFSIETIYRISRALKTPLCSFFCLGKENHEL